MKLLYTIFIHIYSSAIHVASLFNTKARLWVSGRKDILQKIAADFSHPKSVSNNFTVWIHCASLGEFEQGRPVIEKLKNTRKNIKIVLTFFSPSGYEVRKNYKEADYIYYLPADITANANTFVSLIKPDIAIFVKYEFWFNYLSELEKQHIPTYLICGIFRKQQHFFKGYGLWFRKHLSAFTHFYLQDETSERLLHSIGYNNTTIAGDTRFDRVMEIASQAKPNDIVENFSSNKKTIVAGSTWQEDIMVLSQFPFKEEGYKLIVAPHEVSETNIQSVIKQFENLRVVRYSKANNIQEADILIIDNIGMLSSLYRYGCIAYIGGGFGKGIHNILEAATFGLPVIFGTNYHKFNEAKELIGKGGAFSIASADDFKKTLTKLSDSNSLQAASSISKDYVNTRTGATDKILNSIFTNS